jgi:hypothetical protein
MNAFNQPLTLASFRNDRVAAATIQDKLWPYTRVRSEEKTTSAKCGSDSPRFLIEFDANRICRLRLRSYSGNATLVSLWWPSPSRALCTVCWSILVLTPPLIRSRNSSLCNPLAIVLGLQNSTRLVLDTFGPVV